MKRVQLSGEEDCAHVTGKMRFTTFERMQFQELTVIKGNGKREPFDRDKISKSVRIATRKRPIDSDNY